MATIPILLGVMTIVFVLMRILPGDPVDVMMGREGGVSQELLATMRAEFRLDLPIHLQLYHFFADVARGDLGNSFFRREPVVNLIAKRLPATIELSLGALLFGLLIAFPVGILSAVKQNSAVDRLAMAGALLGISAPSFWLGILLIIILGVRFDLFPVTGRISHAVGFTPITGLYVLDSILAGNRAALVSSVQHLVLPSITLGAHMAAVIARVLRSSMLEAMRQDYVTLARAKGQSEFLVVTKHALRNALIPTVTIVGLQLGAFLSGNMVIETVFGWPGLGRLVVESIFARDFPIVQGVVLVFGLIFVTTNLIVDILYTYLNPKITL
ncbi:MAG: ABC transporter permease [Anaerolineales bacterium]|nr:ABC transporter permease [Anaerolineales bacterium]